MSPENGNECLKPSLGIWLITDNPYLARPFVIIAPEINALTWTAVDEQTTTPDIIFVDTLQHKGDFISLLSQLRERFPHSYRVALAAYPTREEATTVLRRRPSVCESLAHDYQTYNYRPDRITAILKEALESQKLFSAR